MLSNTLATNLFSQYSIIVQTTMRSLPISRLLREVTAAPKAQPSVLVSCFQIRRVPPVAQCRFSSSFTKQPRSIFISSTFCSTPYSSSFGIKSSKRSESTVAPPSTSSNALPRGASSQPIPPSSTLNTTQALTWNRFLHLRAIRRRFNLAASIITSLGTFVTGIAVLSQQDLEKLGSLLFGLDPILAVGLSAVGCGALGWLLGPFAGNAAFGLYYRRLGPDIAVVSTAQRINLRQAFQLYPLCLCSVIKASEANGS